MTSSDAPDRAPALVGAGSAVDPTGASRSSGERAGPAGRSDRALPAVRGVEPWTSQLDVVERRQLGRLRRWGTVGALLMMVGSAASYGSASPIPNPLDGIRVVGLFSRLGPAALACSYSGIGLLVLCWFLIGRLATPGRSRRVSRTQLTHTLAMWAVPLLITPPIFSRDVYSYLAVGAMMAHGDNPYASGPIDALGDDNPLAHQVDARWQHTSSPYGPAFLLAMRGVVTLTGNSVVAGVLAQRALEVVGVLLIVWALPRLARRCGVDETSALWLGVLNPLVLFHLIAGGHNEALMLGCMLAGLVIAMGPGDGGNSWPRRWTLQARRVFDRHPWSRVMAGAALITVSVGVKATAAMALAFLAVLLARRAGGRWRDLLKASAVIGGTTVVVFAMLTLIADVGVGWVHALNAPGSVRSFLSVSTATAIGAGQIGLLLGLGDHTDAAIDLMQPVGTGLGLLIAAGVLWICWRPLRAGHQPLDPIRGLGLALGAFVLLAPVIQPWYLLWAALPLAASTGLSAFRRATIWLTAIFAVIIMPNGATIPVFTIVQAVIVAAVVTGGVLVRIAHFGLPSDHARVTEPDHGVDGRPAVDSGRPRGKPPPTE